jgi:hypothetical protein
MSQIAEDGTYKVEAQADRHDANEVSGKLAYIYQKGTRDKDGNEIDLRLTPGDLQDVGKGEMIDLVPNAQLREHAPRYDPESGELVRDLELQGHGGLPVDPQAIPMAKATINYASGATVARHTLLRSFVNLLSPLNIAVMVGVLLMHVLLWPVMLVVFAGIMFLIVAIPFIAGGILAHYGNVVEEVGMFERDELPRPLRDVGWHEDLWGPFSNVLGSLLICYGPALLVPMLAHRLPVLHSTGFGLALVLGAIGTFFLPAVLLTLQCGGTILNLRPDRVFTVVAACGKDYWVATLLWVLAAPLYLWGWLGTSLAIASAVHSSSLPGWLTSWGIVVPALIAGIFVMHLFCVKVGYLYRLHYHGFPWVLQRHVSTRKDSKPAGPGPSRRYVRQARVQPLKRN